MSIAVITEDAFKSELANLRKELLTEDVFSNELSKLRQAAHEEFQCVFDKVRKIEDVSVNTQKELDRFLKEVRDRVLSSHHAEASSSSMGVLSRSTSSMPQSAAKHHPWLSRNPRTFGNDALSASKSVADQRNSGTTSPDSPKQASLDLTGIDSEATTKSAVATTTRSRSRSPTDANASWNSRSRSTLDNWNATEHEDELEAIEVEQTSRLPHEIHEALTQWVQRRRSDSEMKDFVESSTFQYAICVMIMVNAIIIGLETDYMLTHNDSTVPVTFRIVDGILCVIFVVEVGIRAIGLGAEFFIGPDRKWNIFDLIAVILQILEEATKPLNSAGVEVIAEFARMLRIFRVVRLVRLVRFVGELRTLTKSILGSLKTLGWVFVILLFFVYLASVPLAQVVVNHRIVKGGRGDGYWVLAGSADDPGYRGKFKSMLFTMLTLFECISSGEDWGNIFNALYDMSLVGTIIFFAYVVFLFLALLNILTGLFVERVSKVCNADKDLTMITALRALFSIERRYLKPTA
jgi:hypothetical protein